MKAQLSQVQNVKRPQGFSLLEILVVLVIIAFSINLVTYTLTEDIDEELEKRTMRVQGVINLASEFAVLNQVELGLQLDKQTLELLVFDGEQWKSFEGEDIFAPIKFEPPYQVELKLEDLSFGDDNLLEQVNWKEIMGGDTEDSLLELKKRKIPQVLLLSSGEVSPFQIALSHDEERDIEYFVEGDFLAPVKMRREPEE